jgi:3-phosphoglycerate kinase
MERQLRALHAVLEQPARPLVAVLGGAKVADKIGVVRRFLEIANELLIGGAMALPFLVAQGHRIGASRCAPEDVEVATAVSVGAPQGRLQLPVDLVVADTVSADAPRRRLDGLEVPEVAALRHLGLAEQIDHVSTGGGPTLELIDGRDLPGVQALITTEHVPALAGAPGSRTPT